MSTETTVNTTPAATAGSAFERAIARAAAPQTGDTFRRGKITIKVARMDNHLIHLAHYESGDFIRETSRNLQQWPGHVRTTLMHGAEFLPNT